MNMSEQGVPLEKGGWLYLSRRERSGWRDLGWSLRQRCYGADAPHCDVDSVAYENRRPVAVFEDVSEFGKAKSRQRGRDGVHKDPSIAAIAYLADRNWRDRGAIPFFGRRYAGDYSWISLHPINMAAKCTFEPPSGFNNRIPEAEYVVWRYGLANRWLTINDARRIIDVSVANQRDKPIERDVRLNVEDRSRLRTQIANLSENDLAAIEEEVKLRRRREQAERGRNL